MMGPKEIEISKDQAEVLNDILNDLRDAAEIFTWERDEFMESFLVEGAAVKGGLNAGFYDSGVEAIEAWVSGLKDAGWKIDETIFNLIKDYIEAFLKFQSPPKAGPMHDIDTWARPLPAMWAKGIADGAGDVSRGVQAMTAPVISGLGGTLPMAAAPGAPLIQIFVDGREGVEDPAARLIARHIRGVLA